MSDADDLPRRFLSRWSKRKHEAARPKAPAADDRAAGAAPHAAPDSEAKPIPAAEGDTPKA